MPRVARGSHGIREPGEGDHQRLRFLPRVPLRLPFGREGRGIPPLGGLWCGDRGPRLPCGRSSARLTRNDRPPRSWPSNCLIASSACSSLSNSTKAKPRGRLVPRSKGTSTLTIEPMSENRVSRSVSVVSKLRLPTKIFEEMVFLLPSGEVTDSPGSGPDPCLEQNQT